MPKHETAPPLPPLDLLQSLFHYNPITGSITHLQQRGPRRPGDPAGSTQSGFPCIWAAGRQHKAAPIAWALFHGSDPSPQHVIPLDGDPLNLRLSNLKLSDTPFTRAPHAASKRPRKPSWQRHVKYSFDQAKWIVWHNRRIIQRCESKGEALMYKRAAMLRDAGLSDAMPGA